MREEMIISALIGLVGACNNNPKTDATDSVVIKALAVPVLSKELGDETLSEIVDEIHAEKNAVAPDCATCVSPCGNTSDYDMARIYEAEPEIRDLKLKILSKCQNVAAYVYQNGTSAKKVQVDNTYFYEILSCISYDLEKERLLELLKESEAVEQKIKAGGI